MGVRGDLPGLLGSIMKMFHWKNMNLKRKIEQRTSAVTGAIKGELHFILLCSCVLPALSLL